VQEGRIVLTKTYGQNQLDKLGEYASVSKPVTAMLFMQLLEQGDIDNMSDEVVKYIPAYKNAQPESCADIPITFEHLLTHQSGVPHLTNMWNEDELIMDFCPGTGVQYSTQGYGILGKVMEEIKGEKFERLVQEHIGEPVGATSFKTGEQFTAPGGQVRSTIYDMGLFAAGVMNESYVSTDLLREVMFQSYAQDEYGSICPGWYCSNVGSSELTLYHAGSNGRPRAYIQVKPNLEVAAVITGMTKSEDGAHDFEDLSNQLIAHLEHK
jgi:CubicO group peptidase (beta-lactamase class C family)